MVEGGPRRGDVPEKYAMCSRISFGTLSREMAGTSLAGIVGVGRRRLGRPCSDQVQEST